MNDHPDDAFGRRLARLREASEARRERTPWSGWSLKCAWRRRGILLLVLVFGCGGGNQSGTPGPGSQPNIAFVSSRALDGSNSANNPTSPARNIWVMKTDNSFTPVTAFTTPFTLFGQVAWSPDGKSIAADKDDGIVIMQADGSGFTQLTPPGIPFFSGTGGPQWSLDSRHIAYTSSCCGLSPRSEVDVINPDGSGKRTLVTDAAAARWSPDGSKVLFATVPFGITAPVQIGVVTADGSSQITLTNLTAAGSDSPVWSPDGSKIAFISARALNGSDSLNFNGIQNIWIMNADGTGARPLTTLTAPNADSSSPVWSPAGSKLAFVSLRAIDGSNAANPIPTTNIWVINADGTGRQPLTMLTNGANSDFPAWSPDGTKVAYASFRRLDGSFVGGNAVSNIWTEQPDGSGATALTNLTAPGADSTQPSWRP